MTDETQCDMCENEADHDVVTIRSTATLCETCLEGQEQAGVVEAVHDAGWL